MSVFTLVSALLWRLRRERLRYLALLLLPFVLAVTLLSCTPAENGASDMLIFAQRYGHVDLVRVGLLLMLVPGLVAVIGSTLVATVVRTVVGAEAGRGGLELLLATPYQVRSIASALLGFVALIAAALWAAMTLLGTIALTVIVNVEHAHIALSGEFLLLGLVLPLLAMWAAGGLALAVNLLLPKLAQQGRLGLVGSGGGIGELAAILTGLGLLLMLAFGGASLSAVTVLATAGGATIVIFVGSVSAVAGGFCAERVLD